MTIGDRKITAAEFERIASALPPQFQNSLATMGKKDFADQLASLLSLSMEGEKRQLDQSEMFQRMVQFDRRVLLAQLTTNQLMAEFSAVGKEEVGYYYQTHQQDYEQVKVTGIYIPFAPIHSATSINTQTLSAKPVYTEQQADRKVLELRARINSGQSMAALAKAESVHPTASKGGNFGYIDRGSTALDPKFVAAIFAMQPHQVSAPLKDKSGIFLFRIEDKRVQPLEEIEKSIQASLGIEKLNRRIETLKENYPVTLNPKYFADSPPATAPAK
jgi:parvulin-like peptidyl-prolyl isomerase